MNVSFLCLSVVCVLVKVSRWMFLLATFDRVGLVGDVYVDTYRMTDVSSCDPLALFICPLYTMKQLRC